MDPNGDARGVLVLLICVQTLVCLDCFSHIITMEMWKTAKIYWNEHTPEMFPFGPIWLIFIQFWGKFWPKNRLSHLWGCRPYHHPPPPEKQKLGLLTKRGILISVSSSQYSISILCFCFILDHPKGQITKRTIEIPQRINIFKANYSLKVYNAHIKLASLISVWSVRNKVGWKALAVTYLRRIISSSLGVMIHTDEVF